MIMHDHPTPETSGSAAVRFMRRFRHGGIYALERVARDSRRDHPTVMEALASFIRERSHKQWPAPEPATEAPPSRTTRPDVQAALTVIGRRISNNDRGLINLTGANLTRAGVVDGDLTGTDLSGAFLLGANLIGAAHRLEPHRHEPYGCGLHWREP